MPVLRVFFLASGAIAVRALAALAAATTINLVGCGTQPDRRQGRRGLLPTPVGSWCEQQGQTVHKIHNLNTPEAQEAIASTHPDFLVVFAFGQILRQRILDLPRLGCINIHASLLPAYRGASPINAALLNGDSHTGLSIMQMERGLDSGPVFSQHEARIHPGETAAQLEQRLADLAADVIVPTLADIATQTLQPRPQDHSQATYAPKLTRDDGRIDFAQPAAVIERQIRGYAPWPGAWFELASKRGGRRIIITAASLADGQAGAVPGTVLAADKHEWRIACGTEALSIQTIVPEGKRPMTGVEFLRGSPLQKGHIVNHETDHR